MRQGGRGGGEENDKRRENKQMSRSKGSEKALQNSFLLFP